MNTKRPLPALFVCVLGTILAAGLSSFAEEPGLPTPDEEFEKGETSERLGDRDEAEAFYMKSVVLDPKFEKGRAKLRSWYAAIKKPAAGADVAKLAELIDWLGRAQLPEEATALADSLIKMDPDCEKAHVFLGDEKVNGKWYSKEETELAKIATGKVLEGEAYARLSPREKKIWSLKANLHGFDDKADHDRAWLDCGPKSPFVICMEKSPNYNADLMLDAFRQAVESFSDLFNENFGSTYDPKKFTETEICPIYVFADRARYAAATSAPAWTGGHFEPATGRIYIYKDTSALYETLFQQCTLQLVQVASRMNHADKKATAGSDAFWFSEGLALTMANFKRDAQGGFTIGASSSQWAPVIRKQIDDKKCRKLGDFLKLTQAEVMAKSSDPRWASETWAESWAVVYFLQTYSDGKYHAKFLDYCKLELAGKGGYEAAKKCFGEIEDLDAEFEGFFREMK